MSTIYRRPRWLLLVALMALTALAVAACGGSSKSSGANAASSQSLNGELVNAGTLTVATTGASAPLTYTNESGQLIGLWPEMATMIAHKLGLNISLQKIAWEGLLPGVTAHRFDIGDGGIIETEERLHSHSFIMSVPFLRYGVTALTKAGSGLATWKSLGGKVIGGVRGEQETATAESYLKSIGSPASSVVQYTGHTEGILGLTSGRVSAFVLDSGSGVYAKNKTSAGKGFTLVEPFVSVASAGTAFAPSEKNVAKKVDAVIEEMIADGTVKQLAEKWYGSGAIAATSTKD